MNIDLSKMKFAIVDINTEMIAFATFPTKADADYALHALKFETRWKVIPITPPAPKYPEAERPTHCVVSETSGEITIFGTEDQCLEWEDNNPKNIRTCDHWWTNEGGAK
jgi:hypothetical protein